MGSRQPAINFADRLQNHCIVELANGWITSSRKRYGPTVALRFRKGIGQTDRLIRALRLFRLARDDVALLGPREPECDVICHRGQMPLLIRQAESAILSWTQALASSVLDNLEQKKNI
jgi:hypothetical protein